MPTPHETVVAHMGKLAGRAPVEDVLADYAPGAALDVGGTITKGHDDLGPIFAMTMQNMGDAGIEDIVYTDHADGRVEVSWKMGPLAGGDIFACDADGLITEQKIWIGARPDGFSD